MSAKTMLELKVDPLRPQPGSGSLGALKRREPLGLAFCLDRRAPAERRSMERLLTSPRKSIVRRPLEVGVAERPRRFGGDSVWISAELNMHEGSAAAATAADLTGELSASIGFLQEAVGEGFARARRGRK